MYQAVYPPRSTCNCGQIGTNIGVTMSREVSSSSASRNERSLLFRGTGSYIYAWCSSSAPRCSSFVLAFCMEHTKCPSLTGCFAAAGLGRSCWPGKCTLESKNEAKTLCRRNKVEHGNLVDATTARPAGMGYRIFT
jgi:hypothetical protein